MAARTETYLELRQWLAGDDLAGDPWGVVMGHWFDVAAELWWRGEVPASWGYRPGAVGDPRETDSPFADFIREVPSESLVEFGNVLDRYSRMLRAAGKDY